MDMSELKVGITPEANKLAEQSAGLLAVAQAYKIDSPEMYQAAGDELKHIKAKAKELDETRKSLTKPIDEAKARIMDFFRQPLDFLSKAESIIKGSMLTYQNEQERIRREEEARRQEIARKEQERLQKRAEKAAEKGQTEKAEALLETANAIPTPIVAPAMQKVSGIATKTTWKAEVVDKMALIKAVAAGQVPLSVLEVNQTVLNKMAVALKEELSYPGVKAVAEQSIAARV